tara:strand:- start:334 stop:630 length:297 start_codon:yes stop_codon:yes gene_type:complete
MPKDNIVQFPDRFEGREPNRKQILKNRLGELEVENEYLNSDLDFLSDQLDKNIAEAGELLHEMKLIVEEELNTGLVEFKSDFGVDVDFFTDFDLEPKE